MGSRVLGHSLNMNLISKDHENLQGVSQAKSKMETTINRMGCLVGRLVN